LKVGDDIYWRCVHCLTKYNVMLTFVALSLLSFLRSKLRNLLLKPTGHLTYLGLLHQQQEQYHSTMAVKASTTFVYAFYILAYQLDTHWTSCWKKLLLKVVDQHHPHDISQPARGLST
jgi:hypothetical protein